MEMGDINLKETEQKALADQALADFAAQIGMPLESTNPAAAPQPKVMGPQAQ